MSKQTNTKPLPVKSKIRLMLSLTIAEISRHKTEIPEVIHAKVTKARAAKILLQKLPFSEHVKVWHSPTFEYE